MSGGRVEVEEESWEGDGGREVVQTEKPKKKRRRKSLSVSVACDIS